MRMREPSARSRTIMLSRPALSARLRFCRRDRSRRLPEQPTRAGRTRRPRVYSVKAAAHASKLRSLGRGDRLVRRGLCDRAGSLYCALPVTGGMAEWLKALAWKACIRETVSWVRIPLPPPDAIEIAYVYWK